MAPRTHFAPVFTDGTTELPLVLEFGEYSRDPESGLLHYEWHVRWALPANPLGGNQLYLPLPLPHAFAPPLGEGGWMKSGIRGFPPPPVAGLELSGAIDGDKFRFYWTQTWNGASIPIPGRALNLVGGCGGVIAYHGVPDSG